jgi:hypothetical protein
MPRPSWSVSLAFALATTHESCGLQMKPHFGFQACDEINVGMASLLHPLIFASHGKENRRNAQAGTAPVHCSPNVN